MILKKEILTFELLAITSLHILFFFLASFSIGNISKPHETEISFLGPILDSFEIDRVQNRKTDKKFPSALSVSKTSSNNNDFLPAKPNFSGGIENKAKNVFKNASFEQKTTPVKIAVPAATEPGPQPYQKLRLYQ